MRVNFRELLGKVSDSVSTSHGSPASSWTALILALLYGGVLAALPLEAFKDRVNYLVYAQDSWYLLLTYWERGVLPTLANEPLWLLLNAALGSWLAPDIVVRVLIGVPAALVAWLILRYGQGHLFWLLLILLLPQVVKNHIIHLRQGVAIAIFLAAWHIRRQPFRALLMLATPLIHASFAFIIGLLGLSRITWFLRFAPDLRSLVFLGSGIFIGFGLEVLATSVGARQASLYHFIAADVSGLGFLFWTTVFIIWCLESRRFLREHAFESSIILFYLGTYFLVEVAGRVFESGLALVLLAGLNLTRWRRRAFLLLFVGYFVLQWLTRMAYPWLGFGVG